jgi:hypothetical protein
MNYKSLLAKPALALAALIALGGGAGLAAVASADTATTATNSASAAVARTTMSPRGPHMDMHRGQGAIGTVTAVNGNTITITRADGITSTIDASGATITKMITENVSDIQVGERIGAEGSLSGTTITAKHIMAGIPAPQAAQTHQ